jgi:hypothetical protein
MSAITSLSVVLMFCVLFSCIASVTGTGGYYWWSTRCGRGTKDIKDCTEIKTKWVKDNKTLEIKMKYKGVEIKAPENKDVYLYIEGTMSSQDVQFDIDNNKDVPDKKSVSKKTFKLGKQYTDKIKTNTTIEYHLLFENSVDIELKKVYYKFD